MGIIKHKGVNCYTNGNHKIYKGVNCYTNGNHKTYKGVNCYKNGNHKTYKDVNKYMGAGIAQSVQRLVTSWTTEGPEFESRWGQEFSHHHIFQTGSGTHIVSYTMCTWSTYKATKRLGREANQSPPTSAEINKMSSIHSLPHIQGGPDSIRQFLIINNQSIQQHTGKWESTFCCR
jgi:hypothetical protein